MRGDDRQRRLGLRRCANWRTLVVIRARRLAHSDDGESSLTQEVLMALVFLGKDPNSPDGQSPTLYFDTERGTFLFQSWRVTDPERLAQLDVPDHEMVIEFPARMLQFLPGVTGGDSTVD